jgi:hypothetical protein
MRMHLATTTEPEDHPKKDLTQVFIEHGSENQSGRRVNRRHPRGAVAYLSGDIKAAGRLPPRNAHGRPRCDECFRTGRATLYPGYIVSEPAALIFRKSPKYYEWYVGALTCLRDH